MVPLFIWGQHTKRSKWVGPASVATVTIAPLCPKEICSGDCQFAVSGEDGTDELNTSGTHVWDTENGSVVEGNSSFDSASCDSVSFDTKADYLEEGTGLSHPIGYIRAQIKPTATTTQFDADYEYHSVLGLRTDNGGYTNLFYFQIYRNPDDSLVFRCRFNCNGSTQDCGTTTPTYAFTSGDIYEVKVFSNNTANTSGWKAWHWNGSAWTQVIGSGRCFRYKKLRYVGLRCR